MIDAIRHHAEQIATDATALAELLDGAEMPPLVLAVGLVDLEDVRARLARVSESVVAHTCRHARPADTK